MSNHTETSKGLVATRIQCIDGEEGVTRLNRRVLPIQEKDVEKQGSPAAHPEERENGSAAPAVSRIHQTDGGEGVACVIRRDVSTKEKATKGLAIEGVSESAEPVIHGLICTPRECNGSAPQVRPALRTSIAPEARRNSRVSFAKDFGLDVSDESEVDMGLQSDCEDDLGGKNEESFSFALDDSDDDSEGSDIDDEYDFDHDKLVELVKTGADRMQLASVVEEAMASALERKVARKMGHEPREASTLAAAEAQRLANEGGGWDLDGRMTPGQMTPTDDATATPAPVDDVAERAKKALELANARRRRSSAARKNAAGIAQAMEEAKERRRRSLAKQFNGVGEAQDQISRAMEQARGRHRRSISKAADVLESAGYDEEGADCTEAAAKMRLVQQAMEDARHRHRRSIARAVEELEGPLDKPKLNVDAQAFNPQQSCVAQVPHSDCNQAGSFSQCSPGHTWGEPSVDSWNYPSSSVQARISQVVSSAYEGYQSNGYEQAYPQQGYMQQQCGQYDGSCQQPSPADFACSQQQPGFLQESYEQGCYGHTSWQQPCDQQGYQQQASYGQQPCGQQFGAQYGQDNYQQQANGQYCQQDYCTQPASEQYCQQQGAGYYNAQDSQAWQGVHGVDATWNADCANVKGDGCWEGHQTYSAPWRLGSA